MMPLIGVDMPYKKHLEEQIMQLKDQANKNLAAYNQVVGAITALEHLLSIAPIIEGVNAAEAERAKAESEDQKDE
jgi:hypothetical protein